MFGKISDKSSNRNINMNAIETNFRAALNTSLSDIKHQMQICNIKNIALYFPSEPILNPSYQDFLIVFIVENSSLQQPAQTERFRNYLYHLLAERFHFWSGSQQELLQESSKLLQPDKSRKDNFFKEEILQNLRTLDEFIDMSNANSPKRY